MIDVLKEVTGLLEKLPELSIWILCGILLYKVFIVGSVLGLIKFAITKLYDYLIKEKKHVHKYSLDEHFITYDGAAPKLFMELINAIPRTRVNGKPGKIFANDVRWALRAIEELKTKEAKEENERIRRSTVS